MTLRDMLSNLSEKLTKSGDISAITRGGLENIINMGFVTAVDDQWLLRFDHDRVDLIEGVVGIKTAQVILQGTTAHFEAMFSRPVGSTIDDVLRPIHITPYDEIHTVAKVFKAAGWQFDVRPYLAQRPFVLPLQYPVAENLFLSREYQTQAIPTYVPDALPRLIADDHPEWVAMYDYAWRQAFQNFRQPEPESGFVANYIDTAFNDNTFMWDSCFMTMFGPYCRDVFNIMGTLDNFYAKQHADGFICREINTYQGHDLFTPHDPRSTGPNIMAWTEWLDYQFTGDVARLRSIFPALIAYHRWWQVWRSTPQGGMWTSGLGSGMDNQPRVGGLQWHHNHYIWVDATMQQALSAHTLLKMADVIGRHDFDADLNAEYAQLQAVINEVLWNDETQFYHDVAPQGDFSPIKSIGAYWGILAQVIPQDRLQKMLAHLRDPQQFKRPHRVPSQSSDSPYYEASGWYWRGGVWSPTNYMVLQALTSLAEDDLAYEIARNHVENVAEVHQQTGTLWENYAPEMAAKGQPAKPDFVGWTGVSAINVPLEYLIGLRWIAPGTHLLWDMRLSERHGVAAFPITDACSADLIYTPQDGGVVTVTTTCPFTLEIRHNGQVHRRELAHGETVIAL